MFKDVPNYPVAVVRALLPAIWDDAHFASSRNSTSAPYRQSLTFTRALGRESNTAWACAADVRRAWRHSVLTQRQRQTLVLCGGFDLDYVEAGDVLGIARNSVQITFERGLRKMAAYLGE